MTANRRKPPTPHPVRFLIAPDFMLLDLAGPLDAFAAAYDATGAPLYDCRILARGGGAVRASNGLEVAAEALAIPPEGATLLVCGGPGVRRSAADLAPWLAAHHARAARIGSICTGAFALARAGLLDGRRAATHWRHAAALQALRPEATVDPEALFVEDEGVWTSAGVTAGIDLALALIGRDHGRALALDIARTLVMFLHRPGGQAQFSTALRAQRAAGDGAFAALSDAVAADPGGDWRVGRMAAMAAMSERNFARRFKEELGTTPARHVERLRLERAAGLLAESDAPIERVARAVGLEAEVFRRAFRRRYGVNPKGFRARFRAPPVRETGPPSGAAIVAPPRAR